MGGGVALAHGYYRDVVAPLLSRRWPELRHAAGRLGSGSDVLGLDDELSRDHDWGLRLALLVDDDLTAGVARHLDESLPETYAGLPTRFATTWDPVVRPRVEVTTLGAFVTSRLGVDATIGLGTRDWLCLTGQSVLEVTAGQVFADTEGELTRLRRDLSWYPDELWRYVVAADWARLGEEIPLVGRAGHRGDDLGSRVIAARLAGTAMHLAFLLARRWPPYPKWLGTMLTRLPAAERLAPALSAVLAADHWQQRQQALGDALAVLHRSQRDAGLPTPAGGPTEPFFDRPFLAVRPELAARLLDGVTDPDLRRLPPGVGSVEQWVDNVDVLAAPGQRHRAVHSYLAGMIAAEPGGAEPAGSRPQSAG